tara:strand:- start:142 stop:255 length:114 start_codon:yes stop_codon:yes gene_type:complete
MKNKFEKPKIPQAKRALSWSEILAKIEWFTSKKKNAN